MSGEFTANESDIFDEAVQLREWGANTTYLLPTGHVAKPVLAVAGFGELRIDVSGDGAGEIRARLVRHGTKWLLCEVVGGSVWFEGGYRREVILETGAEIVIGRRLLVVESIRSILLRKFMARLLGWSPDVETAVDDALRSIRIAASQRVPLVLSGEGDLVPVAWSIHRRTQGAARPFVLCDPRNRPSRKENTRSPRSDQTGMAAMAAADGGTLCIRARRQPHDLHDVLEGLRDPSRRFQLVFCTAPQDRNPLLVNRVDVPPLADRASELDRIIDEYADDASEDLGIESAGLRPDDRQWIRAHEGSSLPRIQKAARRVVALRASWTLGEAARRLGVARVSLLRWVLRRDPWPGLSSMRPRSRRGQLKYADSAPTWSRAQQLLDAYRNSD